MRILIIKLSSLGDVIHCMPSLDAIKRGFPDARIDWLVEKESAEILEGHPYIDRLIILQRRSWMRRPWRVVRTGSEIKGFIGELRSQEYDLVVDFQGLFRSGFLAGLSRGRRKIGFDRVRECASIFYNEKVHLSTLNQHAVTRYLEIPRHLGADIRAHGFYMPIGKGARDDAEALFEEMGINKNKNREIVFINPNARWQSKQWPLDRFRELAKELSLMSYEVCLTGGPGDREGIDMAFSGLGDHVYNVAGRTRLTVLAAMFERGRCLVTNDSGPMHLAVAVGLPVVALFGPTNPVRTGPFRWQEEESKNRVLQTRLPCSPCYKRVCFHKRCLTGITVDQVIGAIEKCLALGDFHTNR